MIVAGSFAVRQSKNDSRGIPGAGIRGFGFNWIQKKGICKRGGEGKITGAVVVIV